MQIYSQISVGSWSANSKVWSCFGVFNSTYSIMDVTKIDFKIFESNRKWINNVLARLFPTFCIFPRFNILIVTLKLVGIRNAQLINSRFLLTSVNIRMGYYKLISHVLQHSWYRLWLLCWVWLEFSLALFQPWHQGCEVWIFCFWNSALCV